MIKNKQFVFIIGAARSGTTWLQAMLDSHPSVCTTAELMLFNFYVAPWEIAWEDQIRRQQDGGVPLGLPIIWTEDEFYGFLRGFLEQAYKRVSAIKPEATILLDKHPGYSDHVDLINRLIPQAKFVHLIRDGRDVAVSMLAASQGWGRLWAPPTLETAASLWESSVRGAQKAAQYHDRYLEVRYEELSTNGVKVLKSVFEFMGIPIGLEEVTTIFNKHQFRDMQQSKIGPNGWILPEGFFRKGVVGDWRNTLNPMQRYIFHITAGDLLCELGYADDSWWIEQEYWRFALPPLSVILTRRGRWSKTLHAIKQMLGPTWTKRMRALRARLASRGRSQSPVQDT